MRRLLPTLLAVALAAGCASSGSPPADAPDAGPAVPSFQEPIDLIPSALGSYTWKITTSSEEAQDRSDPEVDADFATATARADVWIRSSRF